MCVGVRAAIDLAMRHRGAYCLHSLVHSEIVTNDLKSLGYHFVEDIEDIPEDGDDPPIRTPQPVFGELDPHHFTVNITFIRGDVNSDGKVDIADVTALINYLLSHDATGVNLEAANCNQDDTISIADVTALINYLLSHSW